MNRKDREVEANLKTNNLNSVKVGVNNITLL
jgi:hypothetical protein